MFRTKIAGGLCLLVALAVVALACVGCGDGDTAQESPYAGLLVEPVPVEEPAGSMEDEALLALFEERLYPEALGMWNLIRGSLLELDRETELAPAPGSGAFVLVENVEDMDALKESYRAVFSDRFCNAVVFPFFLEGERPLFLEDGGRLYYNTGLDGGFGEAFDFARAELTGKTADGFTVEVPMATGVDKERRVLFAIESERGLWVVETIRILD